MNRVFVLGAGFSKQAGMPLATELTSLILNETDLKDHQELQEWLEDLKRRVAAVEGAGDESFGFVLNIEQLFDFAKYDEELWRMRQQMATVGRRYGNTPWNTADNIPAWLGYMEERLTHVIWEAQQNANLDSIKQFAEYLSPNDTVLTFNYDTLVEIAISAQKRAWNHGLNDRDDGGVTVLKMHGSIDWMLLKRRDETELEKFIKLFSKSDVNVSDYGHEPWEEEEEYAWELWRSKDTTTCNAVIEMDEVGLSNFPYRLGLAGLGRYKPLHRLPGSAQTWLTAFRALQEAKEIYVVGFSMSPFDTMTRLHFTAVMRERKEPPTKVVIVDPDAIELAQTFTSVFGNALTLIAKRAEEINWIRPRGPYSSAIFDE